MNYSFSISSRLRPVPSAILSISKPKRLKAAAVSSFAWREPSARPRDLPRSIPALYCTSEIVAMSLFRKYKDSVFVDLFSEDEKAKENFLSLYNALHDTHLQLSCPVENIRLDNTLYMNIINDVSCLVDNKIIVLTEHPRSRMYIRVHS